MPAIQAGENGGKRDSDGRIGTEGSSEQRKGERMGGRQRGEGTEERAAAEGVEGAEEPGGNRCRFAAFASRSWLHQVIKFVNFAGFIMAGE